MKRSETPNYLWSEVLTVWRTGTSPNLFSHLTTNLQSKHSFNIISFVEVQDQMGPTTIIGKFFKNFKIVIYNLATNRPACLNVSNQGTLTEGESSVKYSWPPCAAF